MDKITISDLEVFYRLGVPEEERARPQRLLVTVELEHDFRLAVETDDLSHTVDYFSVTRRLLRFGDNRSWHLLEKLAADVAHMVLVEYTATRVVVEIKKFIIPEARFVSVKLARSR